MDLRTPTMENVHLYDGSGMNLTEKQSEKCIFLCVSKLIDGSVDSLRVTIDLSTVIVN